MVAALDRLTVLDGAAVRRWAAAALAGLTGAQAEIDGLNVFPVADSDTGTNLVRTVRAGVEALDAVAEKALPAEPDLHTVCRTLADAALLGACGNSGTIVAQLLRGLADAAEGTDRLDAAAVAAALVHAAALARGALARPVDGTILSVADAAAGAANQAVVAAMADATEALPTVVSAALEGARRALAATPDQLPALGGRVDAGGRGLVVLLAALDGVVSGRDTSDGPGTEPAEGVMSAEAPPLDPAGPTHEVMYVLDSSPDGAEAERVASLRAGLDRLGDSVLVIGGTGLWRVHAHVRDVGAAVEAGLAAGRPRDVRITALDAGPSAVRAGALGVVAVVEGSGLAELLTEAGAVVLAPPGTADELAAAVRNRPERLIAVLSGSSPALAMAEELAGRDPRVRTLRTRSAVQVIAALAVHDPGQEAEVDLLHMATAAAGCRDGLVEVADGDGVTSAGVCRAGDVLGHVHGDVAVIGSDVQEVAVTVVELLLGGGGELVTLVSGAPADPGLAADVSRAVRSRRPDVDVTTYDGGQPASYLVVGVE